MPSRSSEALGLAHRIETELRRSGDAARAVGAKRYLKSGLEFFGNDTATLRRVVRTHLRHAERLDRAALLALVRSLWRRRVFELRAAAVEALTFRGPLLVAADLAAVERMIRESQTWALVDALAIHVVGPLVERFPELGRALDRWADDTGFWVRRAAMLALLVPLRRGGGDFERFARYADAMLEEREFFIRKAIGWVLREVGKERPHLVEDFLEPRLSRVSGLTLREAVRWLPRRPRTGLVARFSRS